MILHLKLFIIATRFTLTLATRDCLFSMNALHAFFLVLPCLATDAHHFSFVNILEGLPGLYFLIVLFRFT